MITQPLIDNSSPVNLQVGKGAPFFIFHFSFVIENPLGQWNPLVVYDPQQMEMTNEGANGK
ncbi:MAG TPA: hypothetical protein VES69_02015 [Pyrinomonadaceae bacterium]|nr:hypothetical protein [Pyrinomonadaceae bacterium]